MPISLYDAVLPTAMQMVASVRGLLDKAEAFCAERGLPEAELVEARLVDDMFPLAFQIAACAVHSRGAVEGALQGAFALPVGAPLPASFAAMKALMDDALSGLRAVSREALDARTGCDLAYSIPAFGVEKRAATEDFLLSYAQPNFYFHATTAYDILRSRGVSIGKRDFLGTVRFKADA